MDASVAWSVFLVVVATITWFLPSVVVNLRKSVHIRSVCALNLAAVFSLPFAWHPTFRYVAVAIWLAILVWAILDKKSVKDSTDAANAPDPTEPQTK